MEVWDKVIGWGRKVRRGPFAVISRDGSRGHRKGCHLFFAEELEVRLGLRERREKRSAGSLPGFQADMA